MYRVVINKRLTPLNIASCKSQKASVFLVMHNSYTFFSRNFDAQYDR